MDLSAFETPLGAIAQGASQGLMQARQTQMQQWQAQLQAQTRLAIAKAVADARKYGADRGYQGKVGPQTGVDPLTGQPLTGAGGVPIPGLLQTRANQVANQGAGIFLRNLNTAGANYGGGKTSFNFYQDVMNALGGAFPQYGPGAGIPPAGFGTPPVIVGGRSSSGPSTPDPASQPGTNPYGGMSGIMSLGAPSGGQNPAMPGGQRPPGNQNPAMPATGTSLPTRAVSGNPSVTAPSLMNGPVSTDPNGGQTPTGSGMGRTAGRLPVADPGAGPLFLTTKANKDSSTARNNSAAGAATAKAVSDIMKTAGLLPPQEQPGYITTQNKALGLSLAVPGGSVPLPPGVQGPTAMATGYYRPLGTDAAAIAQKTAAAASTNANAITLPGYRKGLIKNGATTAGAAASRAQTYAHTAPITAQASATQAGASVTRANNGGGAGNANQRTINQNLTRMTILSQPAKIVDPLTGAVSYGKAPKETNPAAAAEYAWRSRQNAQLMQGAAPAGDTVPLVVGGKTLHISRAAAQAELARRQGHR